MKKFLTTLLTFFIISAIPTYANSDRYTEQYLKEKRHYAIANPFAESLVEYGIKKALQRETGTNFKVKFSAYTLSSLRRGIFKSIDMEGEDILIENIPLPYVHLKSLTDYNYVDYRSKPPIFKSDMEFEYQLTLSENSINEALKRKDYEKVLNNVNSIASPFFEIKKVRTKIIENRLYIVIVYTVPIKSATKEKTFVLSSLFQIKNGEIKATDVYVDSLYKNVSAQQVTNLVNLINPLDFMLDLLNSKKCKGNVENLKFIDNKILVNGKIFVKGTKE